MTLADYQIISVDTEYTSRGGDLPVVGCVVAKHLQTGQVWRCWADECRQLSQAPYPCGPDAIVVAYNAKAEMVSHLSLGWPLPERVICLMAEYRLRHNLDRGKGVPPPPFGLSDALFTYNRLDLLPTDKHGWQQRFIDGDPFDAAEDRVAALDYCLQDVVAAEGVWAAMLPTLDLSRALWRGEWVKTTARMEARGIPVDADTYWILRKRWDEVKGRLLENVADYGVYRPDGSFNFAAFTQWLSQRGHTWPLTDTGRLRTLDETWGDMAIAIPAVKRLADTARTLRQFSTTLDFHVGGDGRSRPDLIPFAQKGGRTTAKHFVFAAPTWLRGLVKPAEGMALAYIDFASEEFLVSGALSGDPLVLEHYASGDPYLSLAVMLGAAPPGATKATHPDVRNLYKVPSLAPVYGQRATSLAAAMQTSVDEAERIIETIREVYAVRERYLRRLVVSARFCGSLRTPASHWRLTLGPTTSDNLLRNWLVQSTAADVLMLAGPLVERAGVTLISTYHDSCLIEAPIGQIQDAVVATQEAMAQAGARVLGVNLLRSDARVTAYPDRYFDPREGAAQDRGEDLWTKVMGWLAS